MKVKSAFVAIIALIWCAFTGLAQQSGYGEATETADSLQATGATFAERLQNPSAGVTVEAPYGLWLRVRKAVTVDEPVAEELTEEADEKQDAADRPKVKGKNVGYRVQVYADNNARSAKSEARQREKAISNVFPEYGTYVTYASPFWRLRVGDFKSQYDAEKAAAEIKRQFPGYAREVRVVRDRVNIK